MSQYTFNTRALRPQLARAAERLPKAGLVLMIVAALATAGGAVLILRHSHYWYSLLGLAISLACLARWWHRSVLRQVAAPLGGTTALEALLPLELAARYRPNLTNAEFWQLLTRTWQVRFVLSRAELDATNMAVALPPGSPDDALWTAAAVRSQAAGLTSLSGPAIVAAYARSTAAMGQVLTAAKLDPADLDELAGWVGRLERLETNPHPSYGGLGRDWAAGYTPLLNRFGHNLSHEAELSGRGFGLHERSQQRQALMSALGTGAGSVAMIGEPGIGKTALLYGLADYLLQNDTDPSLAHHQVIALDASVILSQQSQAGDLERVVLGLMSEAARAGNIVVALDEAQLFFGQGTGAVNLSQVLLPVLQSRRLKLVLALTPGDWQRLKATNTALTSLLTPLVLAEASQTDTMRVLADRSLLLGDGRLSATYAALREAYRLSGRYAQDEAYPGRALKLLESAFTYPEGPWVTATSVQQVVEQQLGVKVQLASAKESDILLHLEDHIHQRMINQTRAVSVVSAALRRARAGVANPKRPIGSFLFLGPTGVGKTELARSLAALYFGSESTMVRLDMSEYQQAADVGRLLASAAENPESLLPKVRTSPFSVVLFDEIEKAHPNVLNLFLQLLDEGQLTDISGKPASFKDAIVIATSNAGAEDIRRRIEAGQPLESFETEFTNQLISSGQFKPELLNRFDEIVLFRPLNEAELGQVVKLLITEVNHTLAPQKITVTLTDSAIAELVRTGYDPRLGARPMRRMVTRRVEDAVAGRILRGEAPPGTSVSLDLADVAAADSVEVPTSKA